MELQQLEREERAESKAEEVKEERARLCASVAREGSSCARFWGEEGVVSPLKLILNAVALARMLPNLDSCLVDFGDYY